MKINKAVIKQFESEQKQWGSEIAISNLIWKIAFDMLRGTGVKSMKTTYFEKKKKK